MTYLRRTANAFALVAVAIAGLFAPDAVGYVGSLASPPPAVAAMPDTDTATPSRSSFPAATGPASTLTADSF